MAAERPGSPAPKLTREQNLFKPVPVAPKPGKSYKWVYPTLAGDNLAIDEVWQVSPVLLVFFEYREPESHDAFRQAFRLDAEFGTVLKVIGLDIYDEGQKMDPDELGGRLGELVSNLRYLPELVGSLDYAGMLGMAVVQLHRHDALRKTFGKAGTGTADLLGIGGKVIYEGLQGEDIYRKSADYLGSLYELQKYRVAGFGQAPRIGRAPARNAIWVFWMPDSLPSLEVLRLLNANPEATQGWEVVLMSPGPKKQSEDALKSVGGRMGKAKALAVSWKNIHAVFGTTDLFFPGLAVTGGDGHLWYLGSGGWTLEDLKRILLEVREKAGRSGEKKG
jgi:hypothetical protein